MSDVTKVLLNCLIENGVFPRHIEYDFLLLKAIRLDFCSLDILSGQ